VKRLATTAQRILTYINENGIKQSFIASKIGMDDSALNARLKGRSKLTADDIEHICWALNKSPSDFLKPRAPERVGV
jgi:transcriptional regulator with XRE-family HTH domain